MASLSHILRNTGAILACAGSASAQCFAVSDVVLSGATLLTAAQQAQIEAPFEGRCLGLSEINDVLQAVTLAYVDQGYVAVRAYLPEQDLSSGTLEVSVIEGALSEVTFDGEGNALLERHAFGVQRGTPVNLRAIEQGLDNLRKMQSYQPQMELQPGAEQGETQVAVSTGKSKPFALTLSTNNFGVDEEVPGQAKPSGRYTNSYGLVYDNLMGIADVWRVNGTRAVRNHPLSFRDDGADNSSFDIGVTFPVARTMFDFKYALSQYDTYVEGNLSNIPLSGDTTTTSMGIEYLLHRDQTRKTYLTADLSRRDTNTFVSGVRINSSSRVLTTLRVGLTHERPLGDGTLSLGFGAKQGQPWLSAEVAAQQPANQPNAQATVYDASATYKVTIQKLSLTSELSGQWSDDRLYGNEQTSLGGSSSIRGTLSSVASGNSGLTLKNKLEAPQLWSLGKFGKLTPYMTVDLGAIMATPAYDIDFAKAAGASVGLSLSHDTYSIDLSYGGYVYRPEGSTPRDRRLLLSLSTNF